MWESLRQFLLEPASQLLLLGLLISFAFGFIFGRFVPGRKRGNERYSARKKDVAFFKGIQYLLINDHDHAIEELTKSVQLDSETIETYVALGNLYRSKGDIDRAIRIRQSVILRPNIDEKIKVRALFDIGLDYRKGGFLDRALNTFLKVAERQPANVENLKEIEKIYEELKDWENAYRTRQRVARLVRGDHQHILAHHLVEMGKVFERRGDTAGALSLYKKAISAHRECVDAYLHMGDLYFSKKEYNKAISAWEKVSKVSPQFTFLAYGRLEGAYSNMDNLKPVEEFLKSCSRSSSDAFTHMALARYLKNENDMEGALGEIKSALEVTPFFWEARRLKGEIILSQGKDKDALEDYADLISKLNMPYLRFQCSECGFEPNELQWQCRQCRKWDTMRLLDSTLLHK
ncbi:MAG: tetratricopeptide repeat protein [Deltaproteobacteria bacterium]|nr:tetratricopeptide repeat protein [Deltaproteobacteria bacterium]